MEWKRVAGRLALAGAAGGCLVLVTFVLLPLLAPVPTQPLETEAIVTQAPPAVSPADEVVKPLPSPLVGLRDDGGEVAVVFRAAERGKTAGETPAAGGDGVGLDAHEGPADPAEGLPPVLSAEEIAAAMERLDADGDDGEAAAQVDETYGANGANGENEAGAFGIEVPAVALVEPMAAEGDNGGQTEVYPFGEADRGRGVELRPPPFATREVQELLEVLGYAPGPLDGIWGERTAAAWRAFARDTGRRGDEKQRAPGAPEETAAPLTPAAPTPSGAAEKVEGGGAGQAGPPHAGLSPLEAAPKVVVPESLRGVMGYRMPLVSRQGVPDQVVSGVLIPAHTTFVILKPGAWELVGLEPGEVERLRDAGREAGAPAEGVKRRWNPLRPFRKRGGP